MNEFIKKKIYTYPDVSYLMKEDRFELLFQIQKISSTMYKNILQIITSKQG